MKIDISQIEQTLIERKVDPTKVKEIIKDLIQSAEEDKSDNSSAPKSKFEYLIIINDPENKLKDEYTGWCIQQTEGMDAGIALSKLTDAAKTQNETAKRKKTMLTNFGEIFDGLKPKFLKEKGLKIKTKTAVRVLSINGKTM